MEFNAEAGKLSLKRLDTEGDGAETKSLADADAKPSAKATTKGKRTTSPAQSDGQEQAIHAEPRTAGGGDAQAPPDQGGAQPN